MTNSIPSCCLRSSLYGECLNNNPMLSMFAPPGSYVFKEKKTVIPDFRTKQKVPEFSMNPELDFVLILVDLLKNEPISLPSTVPPACWSAVRLSAEPWAAPALMGFSPAKTGNSGPGWEAATASCPSWCPSSCSGWHMAVCVTSKAKMISDVSCFPNPDKQCEQ